MSELNSKANQLLEAARFGKTLPELRSALIEELGLDDLSERTVRRDLEALQAAGFDVDVGAEDRGSVWRLGDRLRKLPEIGASVAELVALSMGRDLLLPLSGTPFWQGIETLWQKMRGSLPEAVWSHFDERRAGVVVRGMPAKSYADQKGVLDTLNRAILQHRWVEIEYRSASQPEGRRREIAPRALVLYRNSLYVVADAAEDEPSAPPRHWKLDRFAKAATLDRRFEPRGDFDAAAHFSGVLGVYRSGKRCDATVRLSTSAARWVAENPWQPEQALTPQPDGGVELQLSDVDVEDLLPRVLALGADAEIVAPPDLREALRQRLAAALARYAG